MEGKTFLFPEFTCSEPLLKEIWDYRCESYNKHIKETPEGLIVTEFLPDVPWAGKYNAINCPAMFHFEEGRWLVDKSVIGDYLDFWCRNPEDARKYSFPLAFASWEYALVTGDYDRLCRHYEDFKKNEQAWRDSHLTETGLFWQECNYDGMEYAISGDGLRTTINSYMAAEDEAISKIAALCGDREGEKAYREKAEELKRLINIRLWNKELGFYATAHEDGSIENVRELVGYIPFIYGIAPLERAGGFDQLWDREGFYGAYGPTVAERRHPDFNKSFDHECLWNGPSWPFATTQTICAMISLVKAGVQTEAVNKEKLLELLKIYANSQHDEDGSPYVDENLDADTGEWIARRILREWGREDRGMDYNHSSYMDLILRGACALDVREDGLYFDPNLCPLKAFTVKNMIFRGKKVDIVYREGRLPMITVDHKTWIAGEKGNLKITE